MNNKILLCEQYWKNKPKLSMLKRKKGFDNISFFDIHDTNHYLVANKFMSREKVESFTKPYTIEDVIRITDENFKRFRSLEKKLTVYRGIRMPDKDNGVLYNRFQQVLNLFQPVSIHFQSRFLCDYALLHIPRRECNRRKANRLLRNEPQSFCQVPLP